MFYFSFSFQSDIDECSADSSPCDKNANCANNDGSYSCTCKLGFTGNGTSCGGLYKYSSQVPSFDRTGVLITYSHHHLPVRYQRMLYQPMRWERWLYQHWRVLQLYLQARIHWRWSSLWRYSINKVVSPVPLDSKWKHLKKHYMPGKFILYWLLKASNFHIV